MDLLDVEEVRVSPSTIHHFAESPWARFVLLPDLVRRLRRRVTSDQPPFESQTPLVGVPSVQPSRCSFSIS